MSSTNEYVKQLIKGVYSGTLLVNGTASIITVNVDDRVKVKADLYAFFDKNKFPYEDEKTTKSSFNVTNIKTPEGKSVTIVYKQSAGGGGSGAGAEVTELAESAQCWYTAIAFNEKLESFDDFVNYYKDVKYKCFTDATTDKIIEKLPDDWVDSSIRIANYMRSMDQFKSNLNKYTFHRGSKLVDKINKMFLTANRKEGLFANINKWSPADIWLMTPNGEKIIERSPLDQTFASLNHLITELYESRDVVGVSLKKVGPTVHDEIFNYNRKSTVTTFKSFKVSNKSKDGYILFAYKDDSNMSIQFRSFSDTGSWQGEIKGKYASGGKIGGGQIASIFKRIGKVDLSAASARDVATRIKTDRLGVGVGIVAYASQIKVKVDEPLLQTNDWIYSKFLTLQTLAEFSKLNDETKERILREIIGYAASSTEASGVFVKIS
jgi:hypothetical protein